MVKGISKQVIVVQAPDAKLFEQAIFILRSHEHGFEGVTDEMLLKEANQIIHREKAQFAYVGARMGVFRGCCDRHCMVDQCFDLACAQGFAVI